MGQLHTAGLALHEVVVAGEHAPKVLGSHPQEQDRLVGSYHLSVTADYVDITELRVFEMGYEVLGQTLYVVELIGHDEGQNYDIRRKLRKEVEFVYLDMIIRI